MSICVKIVVVNKINNSAECGKPGAKDMKKWKYCLVILIVILSSQVISRNVSAVTLPLEIGVVRNNNTWLLDAYSNGVYGPGDLSYSYGKAGDVFVTGDWNRDGRTEIGVVRNNNTWMLDVTGNGAYGPGDRSYSYGKAGDVFVTGDWNSDGWTEIGVVRNNNTWMLDMSANGIYGPGDLTYMFGKAGDIPVVGKWN